MRLIDGDELLKEVGEIRVTEDLYKAIAKIYHTIENAPTAFDIEKVVAETKAQLDKLLHICALEDVDEVYHFYDMLEKSIRKGTLK